MSQVQDLTDYKDEVSLTRQDSEGNNTDKPFYYYMDADNKRTKEGYEQALNTNHRTQFPTLRGLLKASLEDRKEEEVKYELGWWCEYLSSNMEWKVGLVNRVIKKTPVGWDYEEKGEPTDADKVVFYSVSTEGLIEDSKLRAPTKGLKHIFGERPWLWQQFALLRMEKRVRFHEGHEHDYENLDYEKFGKNLFQVWLEAPENVDFKNLYDEQKEVTQEALKHNILFPFRLCNEIRVDDEKWDFNDKETTVYTYLSVIGSGFTLSMLTLVVQLVVPAILVFDAVYLVDGAPNPRFELGPVDDGSGDQDFSDPYSLNGNLFPATNYDLFCRQGSTTRDEGKIMIFIVLLVYLVTVIPDNYIRLYQFDGGDDTVYSKINALRQIIFRKNDDNLWQQTGYKLDIVMKTGYNVFLNLLMIFILVQTESILDVILNALAVVFIAELDEKIAAADWFDYEQKYLKAGAIKMVVQSHLHLSTLTHYDRICKEFDIDKQEYIAVMGRKSLNNFCLSLNDDYDVNHMSKLESEFKACADEAKVRNNDFCAATYKKRRIQAGSLDKIFQAMGFTRRSLFNYFPMFRVWSRWEKVLFLPRIPDKEEKNLDEPVKVRLASSAFSDFVRRVISVISFEELVTSLSATIRNKYFQQLPLKIIFGVLEWLTYVYLMIFPFMIVAALVLVPVCY